MPSNRTKFITISSLTILLCIFGCIAITKLSKTSSGGQAPIRTLTISIDPSQRDALFTQMQKFADKHTIRIIIRDVEVKVGPSGKGFFIEMHRSDIKILAVGEPSAPILVSIYFYDEDSAHPAPEKTTDDLFIDLKSFVSEIPNVTITEEK